jgi:hypothetical protein
MEIVNINEKDDADNSYYIFINVISCIFGLICFYALTSAIAQGIQNNGLEETGRRSGNVLIFIFLISIIICVVIPKVQNLNKKKYYEYIIEYNINNTVENITTKEVIKLIMKKEKFDKKHGKTKTLIIKVPNNNKYDNFVLHIKKMGE